MITGFNTDVEHEGVVYHVQTEDKGVKSPLILSLVYVGGTILASKRTHYEDLIAGGFNEQLLAERLQRQHKLICAAIHAGRIEDLKKQTERERQPGVWSQESGVNKSKADLDPGLQISDSSLQTPESEPPEMEQTVAAQAEPDLIMSDNIADFMPPSSFTSPPPVQSEPPARDFEAPPPSPEFEHVDYSRVVNYSDVEGGVDNLQVILLEDKKFIAGEFVKIQLRVARGQDGSLNVAHAAVTLKILGSTFRPLIFSGKTGADGIVVFYAMLPYFTSGRAAILVTVSDDGEKAELRRVIHQA